jgi:iron complex outermembrane receptor protein
MNKYLASGLCLLALQNTAKALTLAAYHIVKKKLLVSKAIADDVRAGAGVRYVDSRFANAANTSEVPSYTMVDASVSWKAMRNTTLGLQLNNLFDRTYAVSQYNDGQQWILGEPRSFFVTADYTF